MIEPENNDKDSESEPVDMGSLIKVVGVVVFGLLTIVGLSWMDLIGSSSKEGYSKNKATESESESKVVKKEEGEEVADYNENYLDGDISEQDYANVPSK
mgnify:CR=1 FL=1